MVIYFRIGVRARTSTYGLWMGISKRFHWFVTCKNEHQKKAESARIIGRKPIILVGLLGVSISTCLFGLSNTVFTMIVTRCLSGLLNGNTAVVRTAFVFLSDAGFRVH